MAPAPSAGGMPCANKLRCHLCEYAQCLSTSCKHRQCLVLRLCQQNGSLLKPLPQPWSSHLGLSLFLPLWVTKPTLSWEPCPHIQAQKGRPTAGHRNLMWNPLVKCWAAYQYSIFAVVAVAWFFLLCGYRASLPLSWSWSRFCGHGFPSHHALRFLPLTPRWPNCLWAFASPCLSFLFLSASYISAICCSVPHLCGDAYTIL